jgi:hypothetical protein
MHRVSEAFAAILALANAMGARNINALPACWEVQLDDEWHIAVNGHDAPMRDSTGFDVPPYHVSVHYNGFPAGVFGVAGGIIAAGDVANETTLIAAVEAAAARALSRKGAAEPCTA